MGIILSLNTKNIYFVGYLSKNKITNNLKMTKIINECENLKKNTNCPNEQVVALLSVIASNYANTTEKNEN